MIVASLVSLLERGFGRRAEHQGTVEEMILDVDVLQHLPLSFNDIYYLFIWKCLFEKVLIFHNCFNMTYCDISTSHPLQCGDPHKAHWLHSEVWISIKTLSNFLKMHSCQSITRLGKSATFTYFFAISTHLS